MAARPFLIFGHNANTVERLPRKRCAPFPLDSIQLLTTDGGFTAPVARFNTMLKPGVAINSPITT